MKGGENNMKNKIILPAAILLIAGAAFFGTTAYAQGNQNGQRDMVQELAQKLGLDESKVQTAFDEIRSEHQEEMQAQFTDRLNQAVSEGKLTEDQKNLIIQKHEELSSQRESERDQVQEMTREERRDFMQERRQEMQQWAEANGIDLQYLMGPEGGRGPGTGMHGGMNK